MVDPLEWSLVMEKELAYVVLRKRNRLQIVVWPNGKQLRERRSRNWELVAAAPTASGTSLFDPPDDLRAAALDALDELVVDVEKAANWTRRRANA